MTYPPQPGEPGPAYPPGEQPSYGAPYGQPDPTQQYGAPQPPPYGQPDPTQQYGAPQPPPYGQPDPTQQYGAPQPPPYGAPQAPSYVAPQYGPAGYPPPAPPKKSKTLPIILSVVAGVLVLCIGGIAALYMIGKDAVDDAEKTLNAAASGAPSARATEDAPAEPKATKVTITEPKTLGGRPKLNDGQFAALTKEMEQGLASGYQDAGNTFGAFYGKLGTENIVIAIGVETEIPRPETALAGTFAGIGIGGLEVKNLTEADTGDLGGAAKCGTADASGVDVAVCSWADEGSIGMLMWYFKKAPAVKKEFPKLRAQIETKS